MTLLPLVLCSYLSQLFLCNPVAEAFVISNRIPASVLVFNHCSHQQKLPTSTLLSSAKNSEKDDKDRDGIQSLKVNENGETYFELSPRKRCTIREWEGNVLVDIREFYKKDDKMLPGKKGISLTVEQYEIMRNLILDGTVDEIIEGLGGDDDEDEDGTD